MISIIGKLSFPGIVCFIDRVGRAEVLSAFDIISGLFQGD